MQIRTLIHMDRPDHTDYRRLTNDWFKPANIARCADRLDELSRQAVAKLEAAAADGAGVIDFNREIAMPYPLQVILSILGLPESDYGRMLTLTQELFGADRPRPAARRGHARGDRGGDHGVLQLLRRS